MRKYLLRIIALFIALITACIPAQTSSVQAADLTMPYEFNKYTCNRYEDGTSELMFLLEGNESYESGVLIVVLYDESGKYIGCITKPVTDMTDVIYIETTKSFYAYKVMLWNSFVGIRPIAYTAGTEEEIISRINNLLSEIDPSANWYKTLTYDEKQIINKVNATMKDVKADADNGKKIFVKDYIKTAYSYDVETVRTMCNGLGESELDAFKSKLGKLSVATVEYLAKNMLGIDDIKDYIKN